MRRRCVTVGCLMVVMLLSCRPGSNCLVNRFTFFPERGFRVDTRPFSAPIEPLFLVTSDGVRISAFYLPRSGSGRGILFLHGNAGNASHRLRIADALRSLDANVLLLDYRGYGLSEGSPSERGIYLDGEAGLTSLTGEKKIPLERIVVFGRSLGSAVAVEISQNRPLAGVVLVSPLSSGKEVANRLGMRTLSFLIGKPFDSLSKIEHLQSPLLILHGERDRVLPMEMGLRLYERAKVAKRFVRIPDADHNDLVVKNPTAFFKPIREFLKETASSGHPGERTGPDRVPSGKD